MQQTSPGSAHNNPDNAEQDRKTANSDKPSSNPEPNGYDSENLDQKPDSGSKDITRKDTQADHLNNDPSEGFETDMNTHRSDEAQSAPFETIEAEKENPVNNEFEIGQLGREELREDERIRDESGHGATRNTKPSQRKF